MILILHHLLTTTAREGPWSCKLHHPAHRYGKRTGCPPSATIRPAHLHRRPERKVRNQLHTIPTQTEGGHSILLLLKTTRQTRLRAASGENLSISNSRPAFARFLHCHLPEQPQVALNHQNRVQEKYTRAGAAVVLKSTSNQ